MASFMDRVIRAAKLDVSLYEEVEADKEAMPQAMLIVVLSALAAGIGGIGVGGAKGLIVGSIFALIGWFIWALLTYVIGTKLLPTAQTSSNVGELLRTIGFASSPGLIRVLGIVPGISALVMVGAAIWMLIAMVIAVRQALDYESTWRTIGVCVIGWIIQALVVGGAMLLVRGSQGSAL